MKGRFGIYPFISLKNMLVSLKFALLPFRFFYLRWVKLASETQIGFKPSRALLLLLHFAFWLLFLGIILVVFSGFLQPKAAFTRSLFLTLFLATVYYINTLLLINILFERKMYWWYGASIILFTWLALKLKVQMDFVWLEAESGFLKLAGSKVSRIVASFPIIFDLIFSTLLQLLLNRYKRMQLYRARLAELTTAQLNLLKGQINPHFLFNNLNNIYSLVIRKDDKAPEIILKLSDLLRYVIYKGGAQKVSLTEEAEQLKNLIALNALKDDENANITFSTNGLDKHGFIEPMILIPLVENCFKRMELIIKTDLFV